jgi:flagellar basal-body rod protein FlgB
MPVSGFKLFDGFDSGVERVLDFRVAQQTLVAGNLANANTPGYLAKEYPFQELLSQVMDEASEGTGSLPEINETDVTERPADALDLDGNSVNPEHEATKLTENLILYNALSNGVSRRLAILRFAASDGRG